MEDGMTLSMPHNNMKKLLLLLLLSTSYSAFALSLIPLEPCDGNPSLRQALIGEKEQNLEKRYITLEDQSLSDAEKAEQIKGIDERILEMDTHLRGLTNNCKVYEGSLINNLREGKWTWYDLYNRVIKQGNYVNGKKEGSWTEWKFRGYAYDTIQMNYKNDMLDGKWIHWYSYEGPVRSLSVRQKKDTVEVMIVLLKNKHAEIWVESQLSDEPKKYESTLSELEEQIQYQKSLLTTFEVPRIIEEGNYIDGKKEGTWTYWRREGIIGIQKVEVYEDGVLI